MNGPNVMQGYNNLPDASAEVFFDYDGKRCDTIRYGTSLQVSLAEYNKWNKCPERRQPTVGSPAGQGSCTMLGTVSSRRTARGPCHKECLFKRHGVINDTPVHPCVVFSNKVTSRHTPDLLVLPTLTAS